MTSLIEEEARVEDGGYSPAIARLSFPDDVILAESAGFVPGR